jgi:hypothetical protein
VAPAAHARGSHAARLGFDDEGVAIAPELALCDVVGVVEVEVPGVVVVEVAGAFTENWEPVTTVTWAPSIT